MAALRRELQRIGMTPKQRKAEALLQKPYHAADRRLGDVELVRGGGETAVPASRLKSAQSIQ